MTYPEHPIKDEGGRVVSADDKYATDETTTEEERAARAEAVLAADPNPSDAQAEQDAREVAEQGPGSMVGLGASAPTGPVNGNESIVAATHEAREAAEAEVADARADQQ